MGYVPNPRMEQVFMAVALDTFDEKEGYPGNIHTRYKQVVGERLALAAMAVAYGEHQHFPANGPLPSSVVPFLHPAEVPSTPSSKDSSFQLFIAHLLLKVFVTSPVF